MPANPEIAPTVLSLRNREVPQRATNHPATFYWRQPLRQRERTGVTALPTLKGRPKRYTPKCYICTQVDDEGLQWQKHMVYFTLIPVGPQGDLLRGETPSRSGTEWHPPDIQREVGPKSWRFWYCK